MEFPITRERLKAYKMIQPNRLLLKHNVKQEIIKIRHDVEMHVLSGGDTKFVYQTGIDLKRNPQSIEFIKDLLEAIKYNFPDSAIGVDPIETSIIIDWS
jgi:hypothetical protein